MAKTSFMFFLVRLLPVAIGSFKVPLLGGLKISVTDFLLLNFLLLNFFPPTFGWLSCLPIIISANVVIASGVRVVPSLSLLFIFKDSVAPFVSLGFDTPVCLPVTVGGASLNSDFLFCVGIRTPQPLQIISSTILC